MNYIDQGIKAGHTVWTISAGDTFVKLIYEGADFPIRTPDGYCYSPQGCLRGDKNPSLFWSDPHIQAPEKPQPKKYQWLFRDVQSGEPSWHLMSTRHSSVDCARSSFDMSLRPDLEFRRIDP